MTVLSRGAASKERELPNQRKGVRFSEETLEVISVKNKEDNKQLCSECYLDRGWECCLSESEQPEV